MADMTCLAEGMVVPADFEQTGLNLNEIVVGPTGCGKSFSNAYSRLAHTNESSVVVPISKDAIKRSFMKTFKERGYEVIDLDFAHPDKSMYGYDPLDYIHRDEDVIQLARNLIGQDASRGRTGEADPYWNDSATSVIAAEIAYVLLDAKDKKKKANFADVINFHRSIKFDSSKNLMSTSADIWFEKLSVYHPGNQATELWKTVKDLAPRTASCIFSVVNSAFDKIFSNSVIEMTKKKKRVSFKELGEKKVALFISISPMNRTLQNYINVMYADMFRELFEIAQNNIDYKLNVPVHIICDDFACSGKIQNFEDYISIFRAAGISVTMLLQSESQLNSMYGEQSAITIINNCDTYVYMGGMDIITCQNISKRMNKPLNKVMEMPLEQVVVFRRGSAPYVSRRFQIMNDPEYKKIMNNADER